MGATSPAGEAATSRQFLVFVVFLVQMIFNKAPRQIYNPNRFHSK